MDISSVGGSAMSEAVQAQYAVKCMKMSQQSTYVMGEIIQDTLEISTEAIEKCAAEMNANLERLL